ncbi:MAG: UDP-N-acetylmuramoyl-tripeptide--D-alanyl-D-alanine ligase [Oscillospiraceae bacterium]|jgi:UDP-N-acetylmuramoyl-tripeptide--D-alanyl-D-alanine ligase|nr:UDP-N-acetylmuramoyl-tripeptide--D-alanyl-D-alanine ligase [Oscillospiraceae bacterium]
MIPITVTEILKATKGKLLFGNSKLYVNNVQINSRKIKKNSLFVPIVGLKVDAHKFLKLVFENGATVCFTQKENCTLNSKENFKSKALIKVNNTCRALTNLAMYYRKKFPIYLIGITGSVGKTMTKDIMACVLKQKLITMKTQGNLNSNIGLPLTMFELESFHQAAVIELGISNPNEMDEIVDVAKPNIAVITNIGVSHIENLKSKENICLEKFKITKYLKKNEPLFLNGDDDFLFKFGKKAHEKVIFFGFKDRNDIRAQNITLTKKNTKFVFDNEEFLIRIPGKNNVYSALACVAVAFYLGINADDIKIGLASYKGTKMRQEIVKKKSITIINDSYNSSPDSIESAIDLLNQIASQRKIAVLADILELGKNSNKIHYSVGENFKDKSIDILITIGNKAKEIALAAKAKKNKFEVFKCNKNEDAFKILKNILKQNDTILVKGSRGTKIDEIIKELYKILS